MAGEEDAEGMLGPVDAREGGLGRPSVACGGGGWSTGKKLHSFLSRMQLMHRP